MKKYIISLLHTQKHEPYLTLWRAANQGYCYSQESAGVYEEMEEGYHDSSSNMPIETTELDPYFIPLPYEGKKLKMIPNTKVIWEALGLRMTKNGLVRKSIKV